jgi:hypothetical protein
VIEALEKLIAALLAKQPSPDRVKVAQLTLCKGT